MAKKPAKKPTRKLKKPKSKKPVAVSGVPPFARNKSPSVKLYLDKINQEMLGGATSRAKCDIYVSWTKSCCVLDFFRVRPDDFVSTPTRGFLMREEKKGGMMWNTRTGAVYTLNEPAYHALMDLEDGLSEVEVAKRNSLTPRQVKSLVKKLSALQ